VFEIAQLSFSRLRRAAWQLLCALLRADLIIGQLNISDKASARAANEHARNFADHPDFFAIRTTGVLCC
jgi:hypothetical protein